METDLDALSRAVAQGVQHFMNAKVESYKNDAERYRTLRSMVGKGYPLHMFIIPGYGGCDSPEAFDKACDKLRENMIKVFTYLINELKWALKIGWTYIDTEPGYHSWYHLYRNNQTEELRKSVEND